MAKIKREMYGQRSRLETEMIDETTEIAFERGKEQGLINARLDAHDKNFAKINGSMERIANEMRVLSMAVQRLGDNAIANEATVIKTATALKEADDARRDKVEQAWTPLMRFSAFMASFAAVFGAGLTVYLSVFN